MLGLFVRFGIGKWFGVTQLVSGGVGWFVIFFVGFGVFQRVGSWIYNTLQFFRWCWFPWLELYKWSLAYVVDAIRNYCTQILKNVGDAPFEMRFSQVWNGKNNGDSGILWICRLFAPDLKSSSKGLFMIVCSVIFFHLVSPSLEVTRRSSVPVLTSFNRFMHFVAAEIPVLQQAWTSLHLTVHHLQGESVALSTF